ncbi:MAG: murein biosynthesis integral membrane protein MurJ [Anaerolineae bacterium]|nr:murein biosynthesis integral membrane protein MurJ [Chloroflexota bacterium]MBW7880764.1 murein biosynthesis integral membrane protein MurJ [Anaerolineae bacterium]MCO6444545.1 murein biosynthesis integral membrane protein MurJ [Anaerolineae bacterium]MDL1916585.1 murein biosynthesis integral membrane protein MurJ [Anaerolineae bacterium CFX4]RIK19674.1 MAG: murein biosynthesis integral membrane protein MurJ [Chloroflexota bacterium]
MTAARPPSIARASAIIAAGNIASRVLGLGREIVLSNLFGASRALEAFNNAVLVTRSLFDLLIAGHINSAIVPVLSEIDAKHGRDSLWRVLAALAGMVVLALAVIVIGMIAAALPIARIIGGDTATIEETAGLIRLTAPALLLMCVFALYSGALYALRIFTYPALAAAVFNGTMVAVTLALGGSRQIEAAAVAWIAAAAAQLALQLYGLRTGKLRLSLRWHDPLVAPVLRRIGRLYLPVIGSLIVDLITTRFFTYALAARALIDHGNNYMQWATTLIQFPQGLVATAISAAVLPTLSRAAVAERDGDTPEGQSFSDMLGIGLRMTTVLILPAALALAVLAVPIIQVVFEHGAFTPYDTGVTALALRLYVIGLPFAAWDLLLVYAFYARQDTLTPALVGVVSLIVYAVAAVLLFPVFDLYALMLADAVKHVTHTVISALILARRGSVFANQRLIGTFARALAASLGMAGVGLLVMQAAAPLFGTNTLNEIAGVGLSLAACGAAYFVLGVILRLEELSMLRRVVRRLWP